MGRESVHPAPTAWVVESGPDSASRWSSYPARFQGDIWALYNPHGRYYSVYLFDTPLEHRCPPLTLALPQTPRHDADVQAIVEALRRIAARLDEATADTARG